MAIFCFLKTWDAEGKKRFKKKKYKSMSAA